MFAKRQAWLFYAHLLTVIVYVQIEDERSDGHAVEKVQLYVAREKRSCNSVAQSVTCIVLSAI